MISTKKKTYNPIVIYTNKFYECTKRFILFFVRFWFVILSIIGGLQLVYRVALMFLPRVRHSMLKRKVARPFQGAVNIILQQTGYAEWFVLKLLAVNIDTLRFGELCDHIKTVLVERTPNGRISSISPTPSYSKNPSVSDEETFALSKPLV